MEESFAVTTDNTAVSDRTSIRVATVGAAVSRASDCCFKRVSFSAASAGVAESTTRAIVVAMAAAVAAAVAAEVAAASFDDWTAARGGPETANVMLWDGAALSAGAEIQTGEANESDL